LKPKRQMKVTPLPGFPLAKVDPTLLDPATLIRWNLELWEYEQSLLKRRRFDYSQDESALDSMSSSILNDSGAVLKQVGSIIDQQRALRVPRNADGTIKPRQPNQLMLSERRVGGTMFDHSVTINGQRVQNYTDSHGNSLTTTASLGAFNVSLDLVYTQSGDHKRPNPHRYRKQYYNYGTGSVLNIGSDGSSSSVTGVQAYSMAFVDAFHDLTSFVYNKNLSKMYEKMRGDIDLSIDVAQARQSGVMVNQRFAQARSLFVKRAPAALKAVQKIYTTLKRSNPRDWGSLWLEWTYGWKPLAADVYGSMENMILSSVVNGRGTSGHPVNTRSSEIGDRRVDLSKSGENTISRQYNSVYRNRIVAFYAIAEGGLNGIATFTSLNPISIAWELVPYSFVADWFVNVGGYLRNMESALLYGSDFVSGYQSALAVERYDETAGGVTDLGGGNTSLLQGQGNLHRSRFQRTVFGSSPMPTAPSFNPKLGTGRLINAAALLSQHLHSLKH